MDERRASELVVIHSGWRKGGREAGLLEGGQEVGGLEDLREGDVGAGWTESG